MQNTKKGRNTKKSIFRSLFVPLFVVLVFQAFIFYVAAVYGGVEGTMNQSASDILTERLNNRKNEIETLFTRSWVRLSDCEHNLDQLYEKYEKEFGEQPLTEGADVQVDYLSESVDYLVSTLRSNGVNGIYLILNDQKTQTTFPKGEGEEKIGINLRDLDQGSNYLDREDLLVERSPSTLIETLNCTLDSFWEARYQFSSEKEAAYYYEPLNAAWENSVVDSECLAYFQGAHRVSVADQDVVSYSIPLMDENGYPYAVLGVELTTKYLSTLLPSSELDESDKSCYVLALEDVNTGECTPIISSGYMFHRCFGSTDVIQTDNLTEMGGFRVTGREGTVLYGNKATVEIYNNNNPFEGTQLTLIALVEERELFSYINKMKLILACVSAISLFLSLIGLIFVSRHFSRPITALAKKVQKLPPRDGFTLDHLGISEIDQLVESIEELNRNASRNIARTEFFSRMSHDMRTPMNAIISFSSKELLEDTDEEKKLEYLEKIHSSGEYLLGLINEVLDMTKIESDMIDLQYDVVKTSQLWDTVLQIIEKLAQKNEVQFVKDISIEDTYVMADEQHLKQTAMNLLSNAIKFTPAGGTVRLSVQAKAHPNDANKLQCKVVVSDTGIGMSQEFMKQMYHPFEQENDGKEGTGLGLSIAKKLIELMGGTIECSSEKDVGTTFTLKFILRKCTEQEVAEANAKKQMIDPVELRKIEREKLHDKKVLVCEDHPLNLQIIQRLLERVGIEVIDAENGKIGLDIFMSMPEDTFDAVVLDIRMPVMDGLETARQIRRLERADAARIPIIAMTANAFLEDVEASREAGMNEHLSKPIDPVKLYETLQELLCDEKANTDAVEVSEIEEKK